MTPSAGWGRVRTPALLLLVLCFGLYLPTLSYGLFADDTVYLSLKSVLRDMPVRRLTELFVGPANPWEFLPLRDFSYWLDLRLYDDEDLGLHTSNLIWFAASLSAVTWMAHEVVRWCKPQDSSAPLPLALGVAVIFAVHPAHIEAVAWVAARKDLMGGTFSLLAVAAVVRAVRFRMPPRWLLLSMLLLVCACFSKATAIAFVPVISLLLLAAQSVRWTHKVAWLLSYWGIALIVYVVHTNIAISTGIRIDNFPGGAYLLERASLILAALLAVLVIPASPGLYYDVYAQGAWHWLVAATAVAGGAYAAFAVVRQPSVWAVGIVLLVFPLVVYLQFVPFSTWSLASDRFVFVSVAGFALVLVDLVSRFRRPVALLSLLFVLVSSMAPVVWFRVADWGGSESLLAKEFERNPGFHNAIRDQVLTVLLPAKRYDDARRAAGALGRDYAKAVLLAVIDLEEEYRSVADEVVPSARSRVSVGACAAYVSLKSALAEGVEAVTTERDISYNNLLRGVEQQLASRYSDIRRTCT